MSSADYLDPLREDLMVEYRRSLTGGAVVVQLCGECTNKQFPPQATCTRCGSGSLTWTEVARGHLVSAITKVGKDGGRSDTVVVDVGGCRLPARARYEEHLAPGDEVLFVFPEPAPKAAVVASPSTGTP